MNKPDFMFIFVVSCVVMGLTGYYVSNASDERTILGIKADCNNYGHVMLEGEKYECTLVNRIISLDDVRVVEL